MSIEQMPLVPHEQMLQEVSLAKNATREVGQYSVSGRTRHVIPGNETQTETMGDRDGPQVVHGIEFKAGNVKTQFVSTRTAIQGPGTNFTSYNSRLQWHDDDPGHIKREQDKEVQIDRTDSKGDRYFHTFRKPDTARKFNSLISSHATSRAQAKSQQK